MRKNTAKISKLIRGRKENDSDEIKGSIISVNVHQSFDYVQDCNLALEIKKNLTKGINLKFNFLMTSYKGVVEGGGVRRRMRFIYARIQNSCTTQTRSSVPGNDVSEIFC
jgi:hypothetical protein